MPARNELEFKELESFNEPELFRYLTIAISGFQVAMMVDFDNAQTLEAKRERVKRVGMAIQGFYKDNDFLCSTCEFEKKCTMCKPTSQIVRKSLLSSTPVSGG